MFRLYLAIIACSLPQLCAAGPNAEVEIDFFTSSPPCGLAAGSAIELSVAARKMSGVRQIKFEFSWTPSSAIDSVYGALGTTTEAEAFIAPGPPQIEGDGAVWGMATFGGDGLIGDGQLARMGFSLAATHNPETPIEVRLELVSLGPSSAERDTIRPVESVALANYCDEQEQALERGVFLRLEEEQQLFSRMGTASLADGSIGETPIAARLYESGRFSVGETFTWNIENLGPGTVYALMDEDAIRIDAGSQQQFSTTSDERGNAHLLLDSESGANDQQTTVALKACARAQSLCADGQVTWKSAVTAVLESHDGPQPQALQLAQNFPNPFNATTVLSFTIPTGTPRFAQLDIFDIAGQKVATPFATHAAPGHHQVLWNGQSSAGHPVASGLYIYRLRTDSAQRHRTMLLLR